MELKKKWFVRFIPMLVCFMGVFSQRVEASTGVYVPDPVTGFVANVRDAAYGAVADGVSDDTAAIQRAIDAVSAAGGGIVDIPAGNYMINTLHQTGHSYERAGLVLKSNIIVRMANGVVLRAIPNGERSYQIFSITHVDNVHIMGGKLIGDRDTHIGNLGQTGYGVRITDATNVVIEDLYAGEFWGDGVFLGEDSRNITLYRVICDHNRRQGMSIVGGHNVKILESEFKRSDGTPPKSGIDIEPEGDHPIVSGVEIRNCLFEGSSTGFVVSNQYSNSVAENIIFADNIVRGNKTSINLVGIQSGEVTGNTIYHDQSITENDTHWGIRLRNDGRHPTRNVIVRGNTIYGGNVVDTTGESSNVIQNNTFKAAVYIRGIAHAGQTLKAKVYDGDYGDLHVHNVVWVPATAISSYQWYADGTAIAGATQSSYIPTAADTGKEITVRVQYTDKAGNAEDATSPPTLPVNYANHAPTDITLNPLFIYSDEYLAEVGLLNTTDPDAGDVHTYTVDDERFEIVYDNLLRLKGDNYIPFGSVANITLNVTATDVLGASYTKAFTVEVTRPKNQPPKKITIDNNILIAGRPGEIVGKLTTLDLNVGDTHTYNVSDSRFEVNSEGKLKLKDGVSVDASLESSISLNVQAIDSGARAYTEKFTLQVQAGSSTGGAGNTGGGSAGVGNTGAGNVGGGNTGAGNNGIATPSGARQSDIVTPSTSDQDSGNSRRSKRSSGRSGGSDSGESSNRNKSKKLRSSNASSVSYSYVQTNGKRYDRGSWKQVGNIWQLDVDGTQVKSAWAFLSDKWYLFNEKGDMVTGWANVDDKWYFMDSSGAMCDGWLEDGNGEWYYMNPISDGTRGAMRTGWHQIDRKWYYFNTVSDGAQGRMLKNQRTPDGYLLKSDGIWDESAAKQ
ncbi:glycosyl hydrolase family 28-related protein [Lachnoanaerobaculum gingivalis]|uniref:glycosyl hydrolase family 28-related protein n=1 Tax=Lachnoanaerobaculum gingivalis TaxID=2490855 RepID=UPI0024A67631|nr:glycosyl hydrolase family 28-related protein [Lachnoanaerobaculum gingivalis]WHE87188.1 glycosyl hydrolase family 28-related protein [Lachnoanaerobaculum gingivalis]